MGCSESGSIEGVEVELEVDGAAVDPDSAPGRVPSEHAPASSARVTAAAIKRELRRGTDTVVISEPTVLEHSKAVLHSFRCDAFGSPGDEVVTAPLVRFQRREPLWALRTDAFNGPVVSEVRHCEALLEQEDRRSMVAVASVVFIQNDHVALRPRRD